jgi:hypothetical protein
MDLNFSLITVSSPSESDELEGSSSSTGIDARINGFFLFNFHLQ